MYFISEWEGICRDLKWNFVVNKNLTAPLNLERMETDISRCMNKNKILFLKMVCKISYF